MIGVPPPSIVTSQPTLQATPGQGQDPPHQDWGPPPGIRSDWGNMNSYQVLIHSKQVGPLKVSSLQPPAMPSWGSHNYGYGSEVGEQDGVNAGPPQPPVPAPEPKKAGRNQVSSTYRTLNWDPDCRNCQQHTSFAGNQPQALCSHRHGFHACCSSATYAGNHP